MATFGIKVFKHHEKKDGTFNVKVRVTKDRKTAYIDTIHYVTAKQLTKNYEVKDTAVLKELYIAIELYRESVTRLGAKTNYMNADDIKAFLEKKSEKVDFISFCQQHIDQSPWMPPYQDLSEIAERFDVSFKLEFRLAGERQKQNYAYTCIRDEKLQPAANELREQILSASNHHQLSQLESRIHELGDLGKINLHERHILALLVGRQLSSEAGNTPRWFNEEPENQRQNGR